MLRPSNGKNQGTFVGDVPCWGSKEIDPRVLQRFTDVDKDHFFCLVLLIELRGKWRGPPPLPSFPREIKPYYWSPWFLYDPVIRPYFLGVCVIRGRRPLDSHDIRFFFGGMPRLDLLKFTGEKHQAHLSNIQRFSEAWEAVLSWVMDAERSW